MSKSGCSIRSGLGKSYRYKGGDVSGYKNAEWEKETESCRAGAAFLAAAAVLIPSLTGIGVTVYEGAADVLERFEKENCFSVELQEMFTASGLKKFFGSASEKVIYEITDPMEMWLLVFRFEGKWIILGPYVCEAWNETDAKCLLAKLGVPGTALSPYKSYRCGFPVSGRSYPVKIAQLLACHGCGEENGYPVKEIRAAAGECHAAAVISKFYEDENVVNRRYRIEGQLMEAVSRGEIEEARRCIKELGGVCANIRFLSADLKDQIAGAAIMRTVIRLGVIASGLNPVVIDYISQEYAQKMHHAVSADNLAYLQMELLERMCREVRKNREKRYSAGVKRALDYMDIHFGRAVTKRELAKIAGVSEQQLVKQFCRDTGMTIKQYLAKKRCDAAAELLEDSRLSIQEISAYVGYLDNNYFSKVFKANKGVSPQEYRREHWREL